MNKIQVSLLTAMLALTATTCAYASQEPNIYECQGKNVHLLVDRNKTDEGGTHTIFDLQVGHKNYNFQDADITNESTLIGDLWEVTLNFIPDVSIERAAVVIPEIKLIGDSPVRFKSQLILTRVATPFTSEPFVGIVNPSKYIDVNCTASLGYYWPI